MATSGHTLRRLHAEVVALPSFMLPMLWIGGAPAAGKSVTAWSLFEALGDERVAVAYIDTDQLGMLYPGDDDDRDGYRLKTDALNALIPHYISAGAQVLVVSGLLDPESPVDLATQYPQARVTFCLLGPDPATLRSRILERGAGTEVEQVIAHASALTNALFPHAKIDSGAMSLAEVVEKARVLVDTTAQASEERHSPRRPSSNKSSVVVLTGPRVVGTSTVGFSLASAAWRRGIRTGFADLDQLSLLHAPGVASHLNARLGIENLAALRAVFAWRGAERLVVSSHLADEADYALLRAAVTHSPCRIIRLHADEATLAAHVRQRTRGVGPRLAGDDLKDANAAYQRHTVKEAVAHQQALDQHAGDDLLTDVSSRAADSVVIEVSEQLSGAWGLPF